MTEIRNPTAVSVGPRVQRPMPEARRGGMSTDTLSRLRGSVGYRIIDV